MDLTHLDDQGKARMVDISSKKIQHRTAEASGKIYLEKKTLDLIKDNQIKKGDVLSVARIAAISGAKKTSELIPLCHNIIINTIDVSFNLEKDGITIRSQAVCDAKTGIEMEALTAVSIAALTIYDMCKAVDKKMIIADIKLDKKIKK
jgi:cyclic pyranopterin phosphate synthase